MRLSPFRTCGVGQPVIVTTFLSILIVVLAVVALLYYTGNLRPGAH